jgi:uncharacterized protein (TIGR03089 family)
MEDESRTELSGASLTNWTAKVAGLLQDELAAAPGDRVTVQLPTGWQTAPVVLGTWWAGLVVTDADDPASAAAFVTPGFDGSADEVFVVSGHPLGAPTPAAALRAHQRDFTTAVLPQADRLGPMGDPDGTVPAIAFGSGSGTGDDSPRSPDDDTSVGSVGSLVEVAHAIASQLRDVSGASRPVLLSTRLWSLPAGFARAVLAALAADGTLVQCPIAWDAERLAAIAAAERVTAVLGDVGGDLPTLRTTAP